MLCYGYNIALDYMMRQKGPEECQISGRRKIRRGSDGMCARICAVASMLAILAPTSDAFTPTSVASSNFVWQPPAAGVHLRSSDVVMSAATTRATDAELQIPANTVTGELDWSFVDAVYLITCPNADPGSVRLNNVKGILSDLGLMDKVEIKEFDTDDEDRIRGCYTSHISVLKDAIEQIEPTGSAHESKNNQDFWQQISSIFMDSSTADNVDELTNVNGEKRQARIMVLEDNIGTSGCLDQSTLDAVSSYTSRPDSSWDMIHLSYIPYVPNLLVSKTDDSNVVKLSCGVGSALGTTAYIINENGMKSLLREHNEKGYYAAIPDVMALRFPETRFASFPVPFLRAPRTPSLVNPQLDDLRSILFQPGVVVAVQSVLARTGLSSNNLLFATVGSLLGVSGVAGKTTFDAGYQLLSTGAYDGNVILPVLSTAFSLLSLGIIGAGAALAPKPPERPDDEEAA
uniref:Uncharacterized protein n=1 Tax=Minutocellus polymorphus TaxID=265543 RepID=A0A7S0AY78_9STRA|mmetsp:Transcript_63/g.118  ORF Transcript_63/g.118 Transcript_63/m.118 type:complete len:459 (+) Transcript_63:120-1496(+)